MTPDQVAATVGGPPGEYGGRAHALVATAITHWPEGWFAEDAQLVVYFDQAGRADMIYLTDPSPDDRSVAERVRDRLGRVLGRLGL